MNQSNLLDISFLFSKKNCNFEWNKARVIPEWIQEFMAIAPINEHCMLYLEAVYSCSIVDYNRRWLQHSCGFFCSLLMCITKRNSMALICSRSYTYAEIASKLYANTQKNREAAQRQHSRVPSVSHPCSSGNWQRKTINYRAIKLFSPIWSDAMHLRYVECARAVRSFRSFSFTRWMFLFKCISQHQSYEAFCYC